jgi:enoyl-CoA hydratase
MATPEIPRYAWATVTLEGAVAEVQLSARGKASRMGPDFWREMPALFEWLDATPDVRVVLVRGEGEGFSHGLDLMAMGPDLAPLATPTAGAVARTRFLDLIRTMQRAITAVAACRKPVVAAVHGWCIGGGVDLITACDVRFCSADARFSVREVRLGMVADMGTLARLPAIVGQGAARELALSGDDVDATRAQRLGLVSEVLDTPAALLTHARTWAGRVADNPPLVVQGVKRVMNAQSEPPADESLRTVALWNAAFLPSEDLGEAMAAFMQKRPPRFRGA